MKKRILLISPVPTHPQTAGNRTRILNLGLLIKKLGHDFYFTHVEREIGDRTAMKNCWGSEYFFTVSYSRPEKPFVWEFPFRVGRKLKSFVDKGARYTSHIDALYDKAINENLKKLYHQFQFDVVIVEYVFFSKALNCFPRHVLKVLDTHDVLTDRHKIYLQNENKYNWYSTTEAQERKGLRRADITMAIQDKEKDFFSSLSGRKAVTVGHTVKIKRPATYSPLRSNILFIGSANQSNIDALNLICKDIFPKIRSAIPTANLIVVGPVCRILNSQIDGVIDKGEAIDLDSIYDYTDLVVNPIRFGTGLKIKNIEALGYSKPLVTTSIGSEGMESGIDKAFLVEDDPDDFSDSVIKILKDPNLYMTLSTNGYEFAKDWNKKQLNALNSVVNSADAVST